MFLVLNKQNMKVLLIATIVWAQELSKSKLHLGNYEDFTNRVLFANTGTQAGPNHNYIGAKTYLLKSSGDFAQTLRGAKHK
jgi:hypothetical protein